MLYYGTVESPIGSLGRFAKPYADLGEGNPKKANAQINFL